jgi:hypothetical protein
MWKNAEDGTVFDEAGKIVFFSPERFVRDICASVTFMRGHRD